LEPRSGGKRRFETGEKKCKGLNTLYAWGKNLLQFWDPKGREWVGYEEKKGEMKCNFPSGRGREDEKKT